MEQEMNRDFFVKCGKKGGEATKKKADKDYYSKIIKKRWEDKKQCERT